MLSAFAPPLGLIGRLILSLLSASRDVERKASFCAKMRRSLRNGRLGSPALSVPSIREAGSLLAEESQTGTSMQSERGKQPSTDLSHCRNDQYATCSLQERSLKAGASRRHLPFVYRLSTVVQVGLAIALWHHGEGPRCTAHMINVASSARYNCNKKLQGNDSRREGKGRQNVHHCDVLDPFSNTPFFCSSASAVAQANGCRWA